ncbi:cobalt-precorrin-8X methylmutase [Leptolyngbya sp. NK1-12]|uniref:Cobalt-precorrin-8X methylmutase n=1 Tax=Leptolyngbya sp. NK1-12 TaxID=2547451 RepID=A0AA96WG98_9CYAN|nr:cobalt-precorrin-8X methylmutase [Leptolyngbya sp. NK1-12]WNZ24688.1 cobalt-precorrin-8X methylmutase [Leptolyngbya sp. NK1-12]
MSSLHHPILEQSFAVIDREIGDHTFTSQEYAIVRRVIHSTADFEFRELLRFSPDAIERAITALAKGVPIVTDVTMVKQGILTLVGKTFQNPVIAAVEQASVVEPGRTRTETGLLTCWQQFPEAIYVIGNAPTALLALCEQINQCQPIHQPIHQPIRQQSPDNAKTPTIVIGAPVGFIAVVESKQALAQTAVPQIRVEGRKGGSPVAAAILNALLVLAWEQS